MAPSYDQVVTRYFDTLFGSSCVMILATLITLVKVIHSTHHVSEHYTTLYVILTLGGVSWLMLFLSKYIDNTFVTALLYQFSNVLNLQVWVFAWTYAKGIFEHTQQKPLT